jgi:hypothetical protein
VQEKCPVREVKRKRERERESATRRTPQVSSPFLS